MAEQLEKSREEVLTSYNIKSVLWTIKLFAEKLFKNQTLKYTFVLMQLIKT